jgi:hypothetical protein
MACCVRADCNFPTFESLGACISLKALGIIVVVIYSMLETNHKKFFDEFGDLLERVATYLAPLIIVGDFKIHVADTLDRNRCKLLEISAAKNLVQQVTEATHRSGHIPVLN